MRSTRTLKPALPLQVAAICYRRRRAGIEFLLVNTNGGGKWTFPKGDPDPHLSHSQAAAREAMEEAGAIGLVENRHFHLYIHSKGVFWKRPGVQEFVIKAFLLEVHEMRDGHEENRNPTWFSAEEAKRIVAKGREVKYGHELQAVIDRACERILAQQYPITAQSSRTLPGYTNL
jgi:8-oxo-dGTP pyrophosphatase MutT (NUDIX family)